jgi:ribosomal protein L19
MALKNLNNLIKKIEKRKIEKIFSNDSKYVNIPFIKGYPTMIYTILDSNYYYSFGGSIINIRRNGYITSIKLRSRRFGAEQRFFINAPQLKSTVVCYYLLNRKKILFYLKKNVSISTTYKRGCSHWFFKTMLDNFDN